MSYYRNLVQGQMQIGDLVMGRGTTIIIDNFDAKPHDVNAQDYQRNRSDEINFGQDYWKPTTIELGLNVMYNRLLPKYESVIPNFWMGMPTVDDLEREWGFDEGRQVWNEMKPLYRVGRDGIPKMIFGRPGQFGANDPTGKGELVPVVCEYRRADTFGYGVQEKGIFFSNVALTGTVHGTSGTVPSWARILVEGPIGDLTIQFSELYKTPEPYIFHLGYDVDPGEVVEISSYPWQRRAVSSTGENVSSYVDAASPYLDRIRLPHDRDCTITVTGNGKTSATKVAVLYRDCYRTL